MKSRFFILGLIWLLHLQLFAQNDDAKNALSFKWAWIDHFSPELQWQKGKLATYNQLTRGAEIGYTRWLNKYVNLHVPLRLAEANLMLAAPEGRPSSTWLSLDAVAQLKLLENYVISPYLTGGIGGVMTNWNTLEAQVPLGLGLNIRLASNFYLNSQAEYRVAFGEGLDNMHFTLGLKVCFGDGPKPPPDTDGDGISDMEDECPLEPGEIFMKGCPDSDGDGVADKDDECPTQKGPLSLKGCPDTDGDGIADKTDSCPNEPGPSSLNGCPDSDGDGLTDKEDACPELPGPVSLKGCPDRDGDGVADRDDRCPDSAGPGNLKGCPDRDNDGVADVDDRCPDQAGPASNLGCPELKAEEKAVIATAIANVQFESSSANLTKSSFGLLDKLAGVMLNNPAYMCSIEGHTDATGTPEGNQDLSNRRAKACFDYLITKGIPYTRMTHKGFGQSVPISDNKTPEGRRANRRVEFDLKVK